ncbi:hypothetical protein [Streptomyces violascens]|uniref:Uncharacterized protein n=1 Tax=Streptomyces violascens TaxID=67381 RepID=A0ABQ3QSA3_9ACTN|nr:hypothetical protein [Streptomyces violascens]GGU50606.1 hypothetical protein GCM10010289_83830 [Streptomyces violascens]GHI40182.1 hypothetical protein Sviol_45900 [Streptomyces violascens]
MAIPTHVVVLALFASGLAALLRTGYTPHDSVTVLYLCGGIALDTARRALVRRQ